MFGGGRKSARAGLPKLSSSEKSQLAKIEKMIDYATSTPKGAETFGEIASKISGSNDGVCREAVRLVRKRLQAKDSRHVLLALKLSERLVADVETARSECASGPGGKKFCDVVVKVAVESKEERLRNEARRLVDAWALAYVQQTRLLPYFATSKVELDSTLPRSDPSTGRQQSNSQVETTTVHPRPAAPQEESNQAASHVLPQSSEDDRDLSLARQAQSMSEMLDTVADAADLETMSDVKMQCVQTLENVRSRVANLASSDKCPSEETLQALIAAQDTLSAKLESFESTTTFPADRQSEPAPAAAAADDDTMMFDALFGSVPAVPPQPPTEASKEDPAPPPSVSSPDPNDAILSMFAAPSSSYPPRVGEDPLPIVVDDDDDANHPSSPFDSELVRRKQEGRSGQPEEESAFFATPVPPDASSSAELSEAAANTGSGDGAGDDAAHFSAAAFEGVFGDVVTPSATTKPAEPVGDHPPRPSSENDDNAAAAFGQVETPIATSSGDPFGDVSQPTFAESAPEQAHRPADNFDASSAAVADQDPFSGLSSEPTSSSALPSQNLEVPLAVTPEQPTATQQPTAIPNPPSTDFADSSIPPPTFSQEDSSRLPPQTSLAPRPLVPNATPSAPASVAGEPFTPAAPTPSQPSLATKEPVPSVERSESTTTIDLPVPSDQSTIYAQQSYPAVAAPPAPIVSSLPESRNEQQPSPFPASSESAIKQQLAAPTLEQQQPMVAEYSGSPSQPFSRPPPPPLPTPSTPQQQFIPVLGQQQPMPVEAPSSERQEPSSFAAAMPPPVSAQPSLEPALSAPAFGYVTAEKERPASGSLPLSSATPREEPRAERDDTEAALEASAKVPPAVDPLKMTPPAASSVPAESKPIVGAGTFSSSSRGFSEFDSAFSGPPLPPKVVSDSAFAPLGAFGAETTPFAAEPTRPVVATTPVVAAPPQPQATPAEQPQVPAAFSRNLFVASTDVDDDPFAGIVDETPPPPPPPPATLPQVELSIHTSPRPSSVGSSIPVEESGPVAAPAPTASASGAPPAATEPQDPFSGLFSW